MKTILSCVMFISVFAINAVEWDSRVKGTKYEYEKLFKMKDLDELRYQFKKIDKDEQHETFIFRLRVDYLDKKIDTSTPAKLEKRAEEYYKVKYSGDELKNKCEYAVVDVLWETEDYKKDNYKKLVEYVDSLNTTNVEYLEKKIDSLFKLNRINEAIEVATSNKLWVKAIDISIKGKKGEKCLEYANHLLFDSKASSQDVEWMFAIFYRNKNVKGVAEITELEAHTMCMRFLKDYKKYIPRTTHSLYDSPEWRKAARFASNWNQQKSHGRGTLSTDDDGMIDHW